MLSQNAPNIHHGKMSLHKDVKIRMQLPSKPKPVLLLLKGLAPAILLTSDQIQEMINASIASAFTYMGY